MSKAFEAFQGFSPRRVIPTTLQSGQQPLALATPRHATPRHATPRHAEGCNIYIAYVGFIYIRRIFDYAAYITKV